MDLVHLHLMMNHVPVMGVVFAFFVALIGGLLRSKVVVRVGLIMLVVSAMVAVPVYLTGEPAEELVEKLPGVSEVVMEQHESAAGWSLGLVGLSGILALLTLVFSRSKSPALPGTLLIATLLVTLIGGASMVTTANLGGQIRHSEIRAGNGTTPSADTSETKQKKGDDDDE